MLLLFSIGSILTGFRIATLTQSNIMFFSDLLPQGYMHELHILSGLGFVALISSYIVYRLVFLEKKKQNYYFIYFIILSSSISGVVLYFNSSYASYLLDFHYYSAITFLFFIVFHIGNQLFTRGVNVFSVIFIPNFKDKGKNIFIVFIFVFIYIVLYMNIGANSSSTLNVKKMENNISIKVDGIANEEVWENLEEITIHSFGGANFDNGATDIRIKAFRSDYEIFFHIRWKDSTKSIKHLPLLKTEKGWKIIQKGFQTFNELENYEDKFALMFATNSYAGASKTAHLGHKPIENKPSNWNGHGYHYTEGKEIADLWHWKATRSNAMFLADDSYIGNPDIVRAGGRRYSAGYYSDSKYASSYIMNYQWYKADIVIPKRLFLKKENLEMYQDPSDKSYRKSWIMPLFESEPYTVEKDDYPLGTVMPSIIYTSNRYRGDIADVLAHGTWKDGEWSLELVRALKTKSKHDLEMKDGLFMWAAAFDHSQIMHTRHNRAIELKFVD